MAQPVLLQNRFDGGMKPDLARDQLPKNSVHSIQDFLPGISDISGTTSAPLLKRGGWSYHGSLLTDLNGSAGNVRTVCYAPFDAGTQVIAHDDSLNRLFDLTNSADRGNSQNHDQAPIFYRNLLIIPRSAGAAAPMKYTGSGAPATLGGSPPSARVLAIYNDRLLISGGGSWAGFANRIYFSAAGNPESWDTTNSYIDTALGHVNGIAPLQNALVVFHTGSTEVIRGNTPPSSTGVGDMSLKPLFIDVGLYEPNAFTVADDKVFWADQSGVYMTDGAAFTDLTKEGGIKNYWVSRTNTAGSGAFCAVGAYNGYLWISLLNSSRTYINTFICDHKTRSWFMLYNIAAKNFAPQYAATDAFYFSNQTTKRVGDLAGIFRPTGAIKTDPNGTDPSPTIGWPYYRFGSHGKSRLRAVYLTYDMRDAASDNPVLDTNFEDTPDGDGDGGTLAQLTETPTMTRARIPVGRSLNGAYFFTFQTNESVNTRIYSLEADVHPLESGRR